MAQISGFDGMYGQAVHNGQTQSAGKTEKSRADSEWQTREKRFAGTARTIGTGGTNAPLIPGLGGGWNDRTEEWRRASRAQGVFNAEARKSKKNRVQDAS